MTHIDEGTIHAWLDGALDAERARQVDEHVRQCGRCAGAVAEARGLIAASSRILSALDDVPANVIPTDDAFRRARDKRAGRVWRAAPWVTGIAALLLAAVVLRTSVQDESAGGGGERREVAVGLSDDAAQRAVAPAAPVAPVAGADSAVRESPDASGSRAERAARETRDARETRAVQDVESRLAAARSANRGEIAAPAAEAATVQRALAREAAVAGQYAGVPADSARMRTRRGDEVAVTSAPAPVAAPPAVAAADASAAAAVPQRGALTDMRIVRRADQLRDSVGSHVGLAGCYRITAGPASVATRDFSADRARQRAAPLAAESRPSMLMAIRLDTLQGRPGYVVRDARSDSSLGWWMPVRTDSARVDLLAAGVHLVARGMQIACPRD